MSLKPYVCKCCNQDKISNTHEAYEMMYGTREKFLYNECAICGSLQISEIPKDMSKYYPANYYSLNSAKKHDNRESKFRMMLRRHRSNYMTGRRDFIGWIIQKHSKDYFAYDWGWFKRTETSPSCRVLDFGCGRGDLLYALKSCGFDKLRGVDPFVSTAIEMEGLKINSDSLFELSEKFDLIMSHHSLEHVSDPFAYLDKMKNLCCSGRYLLIRMPVLGASWKQYGTCWYELDPPRHLWIPTVNGFIELIKRVGGLELQSVTYDARHWELTYSEMYKRGMPERNKLGQIMNREEDIFSEPEIEKFKSRIKQLNQNGTAGRAAFVVKVLD